MTNQEIAQDIADTLHKVEKSHRKTGRLLGLLHKKLELAAKNQCETLGIDVAPLSAGGEKPR